MTILRFDQTTVAIFDPVAMNRTATRNVMYSLGFREIETFATLEDLRRVIATTDFDLLVLETARADDAVLDAIAQIRRGKLARNPFSIVLVTTWQSEGDLVRAVLDSGADDLLCRPYSTTVLAERIRTHALARKGFVVTADYVGPDRRKDADRPNSAKTIEVANPLKLKAVDGLSGMEAQLAVQTAVAEARSVINQERMRRLALQIGVIAGFVDAQAKDPAGPGVRRTDLEKILAVTQELSAIAVVERTEQPFKTCKTVSDVTKSAMEGNEIEKNAQILVRLSVALQVTLSPGRAEAECRAELDETLERIRARGRRA